MHQLSRNFSQHRVVLLAALLGLASIFAPALQAQATYPSRPIVMLVPQTAGGTNDIVGRVVGQKLAEILGASIVVENRPGAGGNIGTQAAARHRRTATHCS